MAHDAQPTPRLFTGLTEAQADGRACVTCGATRTPMRPVGVSETGAQVFACLGECAATATEAGV